MKPIYFCIPNYSEYIDKKNILPSASSFQILKYSLDCNVAEPEFFGENREKLWKQKYVYFICSKRVQSYVFVSATIKKLA